MPKDHDKAKSAEEKVLPANLGELILDHAKVKYSLIPLASVWARYLRGLEEHRGLPTTDLLEIALRDVVSGRVNWENVKKLSKNGSVEEEEEKPKGKK